MTATVRESQRRAALLGGVGRTPWGDGAADIDPPRAPAILFETSHTFSAPSYREEGCQNANSATRLLPTAGGTPEHLPNTQCRAGMGTTGRDSGCARSTVEVPAVTSSRALGDYGLRTDSGVNSNLDRSCLKGSRSGNCTFPPFTRALSRSWLPKCLST